MNIAIITDTLVCENFTNYQSKMNSQNFTLAENLIPSSYVQQATSALRTRENLAKTLMEQVRFF